MDNQQIARTILTAVGPENITEAYNCMTRLRLRVKAVTVTKEELKKIAFATFVSLMVFANCCFASLTVKTISSSDFNSYMSAKKFAIFTPSGSGYIMYEPSSPSSAKSDFRSIPGGRHNMYTANIAVRDYLEEYGWYDDRKTVSNGWLFTAWEKR